jgi:polysaccharide export outer membrane protein
MKVSTHTGFRLALISIWIYGISLSGPVAHAQNVPNLPGQPIGPNDLISVAVYDAPELSGTFRVAADGTISLPLLRQPVAVKGQLPSAMENSIADALRREELIVRPVVTVRVLEYQSRPISVVGSVKKPITFQATGTVKLLDALAQADGLAPDAGPEILLSRAGAAAGDVIRIPVAALIDRADPQYNITLHGGEEVRVPELGKIFVMGNVKHPGAFPASDASLLKTLAMCEGLAPYASKQAFIYRKSQPSEPREEIPVDLQRILDRKAEDVVLRANDILYVPDAKGKRIALAVLEKALLFGSTAGATALVYRGVR